MTEERRPSRTEVKAAQTDTLARKIIRADAKKREEKTARLRAERLRRDAASSEGQSEAQPLAAAPKKGLAAR